MGNLRFGNYDLGACKTMESCDVIAAEIAVLMATETDDHTRACMADERRRFTNKSWGFRNPGGKNGTVSSPRAPRTARTMIDPNAYTVQIPECDPATRATVVSMIDAFIAKIDTDKIKIDAMIATRADLDKQIAAAQKTAKKTAKIA